MRLLSLTLRNYRVHGDFALDFDAERTLIGGPNGAGKSTLAEAAHRVLFLKAKTGGAIQEEMVSRTHAGMPEVELAFECGGGRWVIGKRFAGTKGHALLKGPEGQSYKDDEAETKLGELLKSEIIGGGGARNRLQVQWSHLWVWQGSAGSDPGEHTPAHRDALVQQLQREGPGAVMQSDTDQRVRDRVAAAYAEMFTAATGRPRKGSPADLAQTKHEAAELSVRLALDKLERLEAAVRDHEAATLAIREVNAQLPGLTAALAKADEDAARAAELEATLARQRQSSALAADRLAELATQDRKILDLREESRLSLAALQPAAESEAQAAAAGAQAKEAFSAAEAQIRDGAERVGQARRLHDLAAAQVAAFEKEEAWQQLRRKAEEAAQAGVERDALREELLKLPRLTSADLERLRKLNLAVIQAEAKLGAMSASIQLLSGDLPTLLDGRPLAEGEAQILSDAAELQVGASRLRITPGGGATLAAVRQEAADARRAFDQALQALALTTLEQAAEVLARRQELEPQMKAHEARWKMLGGEAAASAASSAAQEREAARAELDRRQSLLGPSSPAPATLAEARAALSQAASRRDEAELSESTARRRADQLRGQWDAAEAKLHQQRSSLSQARETWREKETRARMLEESHGDDATRQAAIQAARAEAGRQSAELAALQAALAALDPAGITQDRARLARALAQQRENQRRAEDAQLTSVTQLQGDGSFDPHADLIHARARLAAAREDLEREQRRARGIEKLHLLFGQALAAIDRALVEPLTSRVERYLQCIFGPGTRALMQLSTAGIAGLELVRPGQAAFPFGALSGGEKEQVAAAVRLALAEILAADHGGCLPVVFDDAFAYSDAQRLGVLQRMLDLAATRGLQVIVLACNPGDYAALGATTVALA